MTTMCIRDVDPQGTDALSLLQDASADARALYPEWFPDGSAPATNGPLCPGDAYVIAYVDGRPLACGAFRGMTPKIAEVRRMYVHRDHRRRGLARAVLAHLQEKARDFGYDQLVLETGFRQRAAMRLYEAQGFVRIAAFGTYAHDPTSICYGRALVRGR